MATARPATGLPWKAEEDDHIVVRSGKAAVFGICHPDSRNRRDAAFIVRACNSHDELVGAADDALNVLIGCCIPSGGVDDRRAILDAQMRLRKALRLAGENTPELPSEDA